MLIWISRVLTPPCVMRDMVLIFYTPPTPAVCLNVLFLINTLLEYKLNIIYYSFLIIRITYLRHWICPIFECNIRVVLYKIFLGSYTNGLLTITI
ncbi:hypothetical protein Anas_02336 [Armadillidium nasatum]|uniref:Uncharacterized protein n=1 Tax=Armadillidium nasatum TaxID=96803 RepID=A0A5N5TKB0_9CRUS|nr:hypothetical protein Anas_02336 [Armadillidium nasatum]